MDEMSLHVDTSPGCKAADKIDEKRCLSANLLIEAGAEPAAAEPGACRMGHAIRQAFFGHLRDACHAHTDVCGITS